MICLRTFVSISEQVYSSSSIKYNLVNLICGLLDDYMISHQGLSGTKVARLDMCRSILSVKKKAHQMWRDHPFSQRNRTAETTVGVRGVSNREMRGASGQNLKKRR